MSRIRHLVVGGCVVLGGLAVSQVRIPIIRDLSSGAITVGVIKVPLWSAALAQEAQTLTLENVRVAFGGTIYEAKRVDIAGLSGSRADLDALLSATSTEPMSARLRRVGATAVTIPELVLTTKNGLTTQKATYRQLSIRNMINGKAAEASAESISGEASDDKNQSVPFSAGRHTISDIDLAAVARLQEVRATQPDEPWSALYGKFALENFEMFEPTSKVRIKFGRISGRDIMGRPTKELPVEMAGFLADFGSRKDHTADENRRVIDTFVDALRSIRIGSVEVTAVEVQISDDDKSKLATASMARLAYTAATQSAPADMRMEGFELRSPEGRMTIAGTSLTGFSFAPTIEGLKKLHGKPLSDFDAATWRSLVPTIGTYRQSGIEIDMLKGSKPLKATLKEFELTADKPVNGAPTNIRLAWDSLSFAIPANETEDWAVQMRALGYQALDTSLALALNWNAEKEEISITDLSISGRDMGKVSATGLLGNVTREAFGVDHGAVVAALLSAKAKSMTLRIEDGRELLDRVLAKAASEQKTTPAKLRGFYAEGAAIVGSSMLGTSQSASTITKSVVEYIKQPRNLTFRVTPLSPSGITALELMAIPDPKQILEKLDISVTAE